MNATELQKMPLDKLRKAVGVITASFELMHGISNMYGQRNKKTWFHEMSLQLSDELDKEEINWRRVELLFYMIPQLIDSRLGSIK